MSIKKNLLLVFAFLFIALLPAFAFEKSHVKVQPKTQEPEIVVTSLDGVYLVKLNSCSLKGRIKPFVVSNLLTNQEVHLEQKSLLTVNAGFFDPKNQETISYVTIDNQLVADPSKNANLMQNPALKPYLNKILNRSEFRVLSCGGDEKFDISRHSDPVPQACYIKHSLQAGPQLLPSLLLEEEFFVLKKDGKIVSQSASSLRKYPRTAIAIKGSDLYLIIATQSAPMSLEELSNFAKEQGMEKAMAFDGGGSTSIDYGDLHIVSDKNATARKLKSFLIVTE